MKRSGSPIGGDEKLPRHDGPGDEGPDEMEDNGPQGPERPAAQVPAPDRDEAQEAAFAQAAVSYTEFAAAAEAQAKAATEASKHFLQLTKGEEPEPKTGPGGELVASAGGVPVNAQRAPQKVKVLMASSGKTDEMDAVWQTSGDIKNGKSEVYYGTDPASLNSYSEGDVRHDAKRDINYHIVTMSKLLPGGRYYFMVGDQANGFSQVYRFKTEGVANREPQAKPGDAPPPPTIPGPLPYTSGRGRGTPGPSAMPGLGFGLPGMMMGMPGMMPGGLGSMPPPAVSEERRIDPADGRAYNKEEFEAAYKGTTEWDSAQKASPAMAGSLAQFTGPGTGSQASYVVLKGFAPRAIPMGITAFVTQRLISHSPELAGSADFIEVSRGKDEVKLKPSGGVEIAERLATLINVTKDTMTKMFPKLKAEIQQPEAPKPEPAAIPPMGVGVPGVPPGFPAPPMFGGFGAAAPGFMPPGAAPVPFPAGTTGLPVPVPETSANQPEESERRFDPDCPEGKVYTKAEFVRTYGGENEWDNAPHLNELRIDPTDSLAYTFMEFKTQYGGREEWDRADIADVAEGDASADKKPEPAAGDLQSQAPVAPDAE